MPAVFLVVFIPLAFLSHRISQTVKHSALGPLDRALGVAFGVVRGSGDRGAGSISAFSYFVPVTTTARLDATHARTLPLDAGDRARCSRVPWSPCYGHDDFRAIPRRIGRPDPQQ